MVAQDQSINGFVSTESRHRADQRQSSFTSQTPRFGKAQEEDAQPPGPGAYAENQEGAMGSAPTATMARSWRFRQPTQKELEKLQGVDPHFNPQADDRRGWARGGTLRTISTIGRSSPAIGSAPPNTASDKFYNTQKSDMGRRLKKSGNAIGVGMRSKQTRFKDAHPPQTASGVAPGAYDIRYPWEMQKRESSESFFMRRPRAKPTAGRRSPTGKGGADEEDKGSPGPGSYDVSVGFGRSASAMSGAGSSAFLSPGRAGRNNRQSRVARRVAEGNSMAIPSGTEHIDTNWRLSTDARAWTQKGSTATETFTGTVERMERPFERQYANRSPSVGRARLRSASTRNHGSPTHTHGESDFSGSWGARSPGSGSIAQDTSA